MGEDGIMHCTSQNNCYSPDDIEEDDAEDLLRFEPHSGDDEAWENNIFLQDSMEVEASLEKITELRRRVADNQRHRDAVVAAQQAKLDAAVARADAWLAAENKATLKRIIWLSNNLEVMLMAQPEKVRSMKYVGGTIKRRSCGMTLTCGTRSAEKAAAVALLTELGFIDLIRTKETKEPADSLIKAALQAGKIDREQVEKIATIVDPHDAYEIVTPEYSEPIAMEKAA